MNVQSIALTGAAALNANGSAQNLHTPTAVNGRNVFRRVFGLRVSTGGLATGIRFDPDDAHFSLAFEADTFDIRGNAAVTAKGSQALSVELPAPLRVTGARFTGVTSAHTIDIHRLDGDQLVDDAFDSFANNGSISGDFTDMRFALRLRTAAESLLSISASNLADLDVQGFPTAARVGLAGAARGPDTAFFFWIVAGEVGKKADSPSGSADLGGMLAGVLQQEIDALAPPYPPHIDFLLVVESDAPCQFRTHSFTIPFGVVRASFRGVLLRNEDVTNTAAFALYLRDAATPLTGYLRSKLTTLTRAAVDRAAERSMDEHAIGAVVHDLNQALQSEAFYAEPRFAGITLTPETLAAALAAPAGIARTRVNRVLLAEAFPGIVAPITEPSDDEKEVLEAQGAITARDLNVDLPGNATLRSATIRLEGDLKGDAPTDTPTSESTGGPDWDAPIPSQLGVAVDAARAVALRLQPENAIDTTGISLAIAGTLREAELVAEIREDREGTPAGRVLAAGSAVAQLDHPAWLRFEFNEPVLLQSRPCWIVLRAARGAALWLATHDAALTRVGAPAEKGWTDHGGFADTAPFLHVWARTANGAAAAGTGAADLTNRLRITIGNITVSPIAGETGRARTISIALALQQWLDAHPASLPVVTVPIRVSALGSGAVTIYPPAVEYDH